ncbi:hypothetical protein [Nocardioides sp. B-3]|uniref:hypothetical protein n=1 Tax=Nocardioides sp. B-3 TaxID=2895565 RepID=UPI0021523CC8|nr:hypothetical protein [Nocardioides sp. B-3]UUZ60000.1 hypothetical protein LP418_02995 [Nocardioides sp. B-3]
MAEFDVNAAENLDPCMMVPKETWLTFVPKGNRDDARARQQLLDRPLGTTSLLSTFIKDEYPKYACVVTYDSPKTEISAVAPGLVPRPLSPAEGQQDLRRWGRDGARPRHLRRCDGGDLLTANAVGLTSYDAGFFVTVDAPIGSDRRLDQEQDADGKGKVFRMDRRMLDVLDLIAEYKDTQPPIQLPEGCPEPQDSAITAVMGKVRYARGSHDGEGTQFCLYRNPERGTVLRLRGGAGTQEVLDGLLATLEAEARQQDRFDGSTGARGRAATASNGLAAGSPVDTEELRYAFADVEIDDFERDAPKIPRPALIELLEAYYASEPWSVPAVS